MHDTHGAVVCVVCAAPRMAEEHGLDGDGEADNADAAQPRPSQRTAAVAATERAIANQEPGDESDEDGASLQRIATRDGALESYSL